MSKKGRQIMGENTLKGKNQMGVKENYIIKI